ncbi:MAG: arginine deiminase family protein [Spirochaetales bacterium]
MPDVKLNIVSEIDPLEAVIVHTPGAEVEQMAPDRAGELLYNDIIPIATVAAEHRRLVNVLNAHAEVYELTHLLARALEAPELRVHLLDRLCAHEPARRRRDELEAMSSLDLTRAVVTGLRKRHDNLEDYLSQRTWDIPPLPNLYFMRDAGFVIGDRPAVSAMAHAVRDGEAAVNSTVFRFLTGEKMEPLFDGGSDFLRSMFCSSTTGAERSVRLEGGDVHVLRDDLLVVGISERSSTRAVDMLAEAVVAIYERPVTLIACLLPSTRSCIHLDMVFTRIDYDHALVHAPAMWGPGALRSVRMDLSPTHSPSVYDSGTLLEALEGAGVDLKPVVCGGSDIVHQKREQWLSGTNAFALSPGRIVVYDCNRYTLEALDRAGYPVVEADEIVPGGGAARTAASGPSSGAAGLPRATPESPRATRESPKATGETAASLPRAAIALAGAELARGGGGPRCMTMPLRRSR